MAEYVKVRRSAKPPRMPQNDRIAAAGKDIATECTGKKGAEYKQCRIAVLDRHFPKPTSAEQPG